MNKIGDIFLHERVNHKYWNIFNFLHFCKKKKKDLNFSHKRYCVVCDILNVFL
jgi:hypothetical protein